MAVDAAATDRAGEGGEALGSARLSYAIGAGLALALLVIYQLLPPRALVDPEVGRFAVGRYFAVMIGFYVAAVPMLARAAVADLGALDALPAQLRERFQREVVRPSLFWLLVVTACALSLHVGITVFLGVRDQAWSDSGFWWSRAGFTFAVGQIHIFFFAYFTAVVFTQGSRFLQMARELPSVDLLGHEDVAPFVRVALRLALLVALGFALAIAFHFDWDAGAFAPQTLIMVPVLLLSLMGAFLLPLWGVHVRLRDSRRDELRRIHAAIRGEPGALSGSTILGQTEQLSTVDLLAYRGQVQALGTWPVDSSSVARLGLYLGIPLIGWIGGALVERLMDSFLD